MRAPFEKWHGLGNDFVLVERSALPRELTDAEVRAICDRRRGVGADGVLMVDRTTGVAGVMVVRNADGSRPEMCGNGLRCVAGYLAGVGGALSLVVRTDAGDLGCSVEPTEGARVDGRAVVLVGMGKARFEGSLEVPLPAELGAGRRTFDRVSMGNPHAVTFEPADEAFIDRFAPVVERAPVGGTNVEYVRDEGDALAVRVWERGVGYTEACGTGACAVAAAACRRGIRRWGAPIVVRLPGGDLTIAVDEASLEVTMRGPARRVFRGELELADA
jgi:diaminopimelate epimerase